MIYLINILTIIFFSLLSLSVFPYLKILGVVPLLVPLFLISLSYFRKGYEPFLLAAFAGFFFDLFSSYPFGYYIFFFLFVSVIVKIMFQEGMRTLSFWYYFLLSSFSLFIFYSSQLVFLYFEKANFTVELLYPILSGLVVNLVCVILLYIFSDWYFDRIASLEDKLKRR